MPITFTTKGSFQRTQATMERMAKTDFSTILNKYGQIGVTALSSVTPTDSGMTSLQWNYTISPVGKRPRIWWHNEHLTDNGTPLVILLEFGHGTGTGGYVAGKRFIKPTIEPIFAQILAEVRREVTRR